jgi:hypothetical protein
MHSVEIKRFIRDHADLFWSIPDDSKENISEAVLVEYILNYGTLDDFRELVRLMGLQRLARIFNDTRGRQKMNYFPEIFNFFSLYFKYNI